MRTTKTYKFLTSPFGAIALFLCLASHGAWGQLNIASKNTPFTIDFSTTVGGVNDGALGDGAAIADITSVGPAAGRLDAGAWHFEKDSASAIDVAASFGTAQSGRRNSIFARTPAGAANSVAGAGWYGFNIGGTNRALGWQPDGSFATQGAITLRVRNNTPSTVVRLDVSYRVIELNNSNGSNRVRFAHSATAGGPYSGNLIPGLDVTSVNNEPNTGIINIAGGAGLGVSIVGTGALGGQIVRLNHASGANSTININDAIFITNGIAPGTNLRRVTGYVVAKPSATQTDIEIDPSITAVANANPGGGFIRLAHISYLRTVTLNVSIPVGGDYHLRWLLDNTGADEMAIDDITVTADPVGLAITNVNTSFVIDFDRSVTNVNNDTLACAPTFVVANPASGQLDREAWSIVPNGLTAPGTTASDFGLADVSGGLGKSRGDVTTAGWYSFGISNFAPATPDNNRALGLQGDATFGVNAGITLRATNATGANVQDFRISYVVWYKNNAAGQKRIRCFVSETNNGAAGSYVQPAGTTLTTPNAAAASPEWIGVNYSFVARASIPALNVPNGGSFYIRFHIDNTGDDEIAIDDISIIASALPINSANPNRDLVWAYEGFDYYGNDLATPFSIYKGIPTIAGEFSQNEISLHGISTNATSRYTGLNSPVSLGWAGDWLDKANRNTATAPASGYYVTVGKEEAGFSIPKPTIPITSASELVSLVNSGMYAESGNTTVTIGRRLQTSTAGYAFQYTAAAPTTPVPCTSISGDCPFISPIRHNTDVRVVNHIRTASGAPASDWTHTQNTRFGAEGSTVWVGVMLRKNHNNDDPVFISLHRNTDPWDAATANAIQVGYFGASCNDGAGNRYWGIRVNGQVYVNTSNVNTRITTAQDIGGTGYLGPGTQPLANSTAERVFDLLVIRVDFSRGTTPSIANLAAPDNTYDANHRVRLYVMRDIARDNTSPNTNAYPLVPNPRGYADPTGANLDLFQTVANLDVAANIDIDTDVAASYTTPAALTPIPAATDISFHSVAFSAVGNNVGAMDEFRLGGSFAQAALSSPIISLIRGLCSANGGTLGSEVYQGGDFGNAGDVMDINGNCIDGGGAVIPCATSTSINTSGSQDANSTIPILGTDGIWSTQANNANGATGLNGLNPSSYPNNSDDNSVIIAPGGVQMFSGGPLYNSLTGGQYIYRANNNGQPNDGSYTIATQSRRNFGPAWIPMYDNSPFRNGYLMVINATYSRGKFFDQTITGLCADTQYEFSVDITNLLRSTRTVTNDIPSANPAINYTGPIHVATRTCDAVLEPGCQQFSFAGTSPNGGSIGIGAVTDGGVPSGSFNRAYSLNPEIEFLLNDSPIYTTPVSIANRTQESGFSTSNPANRWRKVGFTFVTKANLATNVNLAMRNIAPGGMGNDLAIDNISFRPCGSFSYLLDAISICQPGGGIRAVIGKAGAGLTNARVRFQKWTPGFNPTNIINVTGISLNTIPDVDEVTITHPAGQNTAVNVGDVLTFNFGFLTASGSNEPHEQNGEVLGNSNPLYHVLCGRKAIVLSKTATTLVVNIAEQSGTPTVFNLTNSPYDNLNEITTFGNLFISSGGDDINGNGIPEESEWQTITSNPIDGQDYSDRPVSDAEAITAGITDGSAQATVEMPVLENPVDDTPPFPNGTLFRAVFAGNTTNLSNVRCRFIIPAVPVSCGILPTNAIELKAIRQQSGANLTWKVKEEAGIVRYILERSFDAVTYQPVAAINANRLAEYKYLDAAPFKGTNYYRVKAVFAGDRYEYSNIAKIDWDAQEGVTIYPNPANNEVNVTFASDFSAEDKVSVRILSAMGVAISNQKYELEPGSRSLTLNTSNLSNGLYLLEININGTNKIVHKMVIKH